MNKIIQYKNSTYVVGYNFSTERCINGYTYHTISIFKVNGTDIDTFTNSWKTQGENKQSIIAQIKVAIDKYREQNSKKEFSYLNEFQNWNGNLDGWDE
jgi:hypothetical protein